MIAATGRAVALTIDDATMAGEARRAAVAMAGLLGFDEAGRGRVAIVVTEAATNLSKHATGGQVVIQGLESGEVGGVEILALDRGPGMADVDRCRADGYSTAGSPGAGLGAMGRLSSLFDVHSLPGVGSAMLARLWASEPPGRPAARLEFGAVSLPMAGEEACGDSWAIREPEGDGPSLVMVVDGLGHGPQAADAAREAVRVFRLTQSLDPAEILNAAHAAMRATRGAAMAIARVDPARGEVRYAGVGNIAGSVFDPAAARSTSMVSHNGTVGHTIRKIQEFTYPWAPGALLVMHSDGLATQWQIGRYAGLGGTHPGVVAGTLYRDFKRGRDDVTVVAAREGSGAPR